MCGEDLALETRRHEHVQLTLKQVQSNNFTQQEKLTTTGSFSMARLYVSFIGTKKDDTKPMQQKHTFFVHFRTIADDIRPEEKKEKSRPKDSESESIDIRYPQLEPFIFGHFHSWLHSGIFLDASVFSTKTYQEVWDLGKFLGAPRMQSDMMDCIRSEYKIGTIKWMNKDIFIRYLRTANARHDRFFINSFWTY
jgi:hypothetical protein